MLEVEQPEANSAQSEMKPVEKPTPTALLTQPGVEHVNRGSVVPVAKMKHRWEF